MTTIYRIESNRYRRGEVIDVALPSGEVVERVFDGFVRNARGALVRYVHPDGHFCFVHPSRVMPVVRWPVTR